MQHLLNWNDSSKSVNFFLFYCWGSKLYSKNITLKNVRWPAQDIFLSFGRVRRNCIGKMNFTKIGQLIHKRLPVQISPCFRMLDFLGQYSPSGGGTRRSNFPSLLVNGHDLPIECLSSWSAWSISSIPRIKICRLTLTNANRVVVKWTFPSMSTGMFIRTSRL